MKLNCYTKYNSKIEIHQDDNWIKKFFLHKHAMIQDQSRSFTVGCMTNILTKTLTSIKFSSTVPLLSLSSILNVSVNENLDM